MNLCAYVTTESDTPMVVVEDSRSNMVAEFTPTEARDFARELVARADYADGGL